MRLNKSSAAWGGDRKRRSACALVGAHNGIRTDTHRLIYFWKKDQWECYDLGKDPAEMHNIYNDPKTQKTVAALKQQLAQLKKDYKDNNQFANEQPAESSYVNAPPPKKK